ncbi:putative hydroxymethylpyrimidine transport system ATP-binding protein [Paenibacillus catalpae]|uniref:Putative hydroxymethylpyrimidine transport system ATP-binding protein n=1 Tax=Paenibacillus catalpae TaxID=1045775 RepID=A0A1I1WWV7_9BACL|nr:ABC transporter ATP-binding protein [Paenibacillus catalpae]SFD99617.1 putative hydroxymethylpyrimidine transport system ATP-binding protein [Paenibacillus catalpae]
MSRQHVTAEPPRAGLSVQGLTYRFDGEEPLFEGLDLEVPQGQFVSIVAASGMGKTTLFRLLAGLLQPDSGTIKTASAGLVHQEQGAGRRTIGYMPQRDCLMPWRTVLDNAAIGLELAGVSKREARRRVLELLPELGLAGTEAKYPHELSGGMRQRVSFLRSLLAGGDLLLLDEPFSALDAMTRVSMQQWLLQVWEKHRKTILFITHDIDEALLLSDQVLVAASRPITRLEPLEVDLPRPRDYETTLDERFVYLKRQLLRQLGRIAPSGEGGGVL